MILSIILAIVIVVVFRFGICGILLQSAEEIGCCNMSGSQAHDQKVEETNQSHRNRDGGINWVICIEQEQSDKDHEQALAVQEAKELEVLERSLPLKLSHQ